MNKELKPLIYWDKITGALRRGVGGDKIILLTAIAIVFVVFTSLNQNFLSWTNVTNILVAASLVGLVAVGETYLIIAGHVDLSPGAVVAFAGVMSAFLVENQIWGVQLGFGGALFVTVCFCVATGLMNAGMVNLIKLEPFIATLVTQSMVRGAAYIICGGKSIPIKNPTFLRLGKIRLPQNPVKIIDAQMPFDLGNFHITIPAIPMYVWIMVLTFAIFGFMLARTKFGRSIYVVGGNKDAARLAGLNPRRIMTVCYVMMGAICAIGGVMFAARMNMGQPSANVNLEFDAITAVILGGVSFAGGVGSMSGTILGMILIQAFNTGLTMVNVDSFWQYVARGGLLLFALTSDYIRKANREKTLLNASKRGR
jgi:ribose transport system permease protein